MLTWLTPDKHSRYTGPEILGQVLALREGRVRPCPRCQERKVLTGDQAPFNAVSKRDGKQICASCKVREAIQDARKSE